MCPFGNGAEIPLPSSLGQLALSSGQQKKAEVTSVILQAGPQRGRSSPLSSWDGSSSGQFHTRRSPCSTERPCEGGASAHVRVSAERQPTGGAPAGHRRPPGETSDALTTHFTKGEQQGPHNRQPQAQALGAKEGFSVTLSEEEANPAENQPEMTRTWKRHWRTT